MGYRSNQRRAELETSCCLWWLWLSGYDVFIWRSDYKGIATRQTPIGWSQLWCWLVHSSHRHRVYLISPEPKKVFDWRILQGTLVPLAFKMILLSSKFCSRTKFCSRKWSGAIRTLAGKIGIFPVQVYSNMGLEWVSVYDSMTLPNNNPGNPNVYGVPLERIKTLSLNRNIDVWGVTLALSVSRCIYCVFLAMYQLSNTVPYIAHTWVVLHQENMTQEFLPFALPEIGDDEIAEVIDTLRSGWVTTGPKVSQFESDFSKFLKPHFWIRIVF